MRDAPKPARSLIRKACESHQAFDLAFGETTAAAKKLDTSWTCFCGASFASKSSLDGHRGTAHGCMNVAAYFAPPDYVCPCCLVEFSNRTLLISHMSRGSGTCLVNTLLRNTPLLTHVELREVQQRERIEQAEREKSGLPRFKAEFPPVRHFGPLCRKSRVPTCRRVVAAG